MGAEGCTRRKGNLMAKFPLHPKNPERICWGCEKLCSADDMCCGNGTIRSPHPCELIGDDWYEWLPDQERAEAQADATSAAG
jgi:hypothetical protein